ncbi:MFS general substrate transporter [Macrolepiota fuliginosa MF-IS2]|uniref:MFS general substrate transporter n=1 Tax=Macrolepiota fuliginosa MF-IS2 TaxID=1400762 RepID=A0A9P5XJF1_9AGAR|nr:MFS general substrate transporter [Macrolepiota fuliginosa MF-IS2]
MSILVLIYILNYIDRNSAAAARLRGFEEDLGLEGKQFASILSILYVGYILMQIPSNMFLSSIDKPSIYLPCCTMVWGFVSLGTGFTTNYYSALFARFLLGFVEAAFFPGALFLIAKWYKRSELSQRTSLFTCGSLISNAFGSLIASGILDMMDGVLGYTAWRWLFFVEGGLTIAVAILAFFVLPDFPETEYISWLTPAEHALARRRMIEDAPGASYPKPSADYETSKYSGAMAGLMMALADWKVWYIALTLFLYVITLSFHLYFPTLTATMGYDPIITLLLCAPPWIAATAWTLWLCRHSDRMEERCMHVILPLVIGIVGFMMSMSTMNITIRYISMFLMAQTNAGFMCFLAWMSSTVSNPPVKRPVAIALINAISQSGNVLGSYVWVKTWGPTYNKSYAICIMTALACMAMCLWLRRTLKRLNREMDLKDEINSEGVGSSGKPWRYYT